MNVRPDFEPLVLKAAEVAALLRMTEESFRSARQRLADLHGFPSKLPGINGWSRPCIVRWIETNGESHRPELPAEPDAIAAARRHIEELYA